MIDERGESGLALHDHRAGSPLRELAKHPGSTVIHNLITSPRRPRDHRRAPAAYPCAQARRSLLHQGRDGPHGRGLRRGALGPLLLPRLLVRRLGHAGRAARAGRSREQEQPLSRVLAPYSRYTESGEINSTVADQREALVKVREQFAGRGEVDELDGLTVTGSGWWFNLRPSNTEPLLRLNAEAADESQMAAIRDKSSLL
ncbi:hypothetical protein [Nonomuraea dietziae]|uniref:hypothetical protein n=1 Tax=Nonomuraea dietziae TaxID=65515 RepID=UPI00337F981C